MEIFRTIIKNYFMYVTSVGDQVKTFAKIAYDMYKHGWNTGDFSQFMNLLNKVGVKYFDASEDVLIDGRSGYKHILKLIQEKTDQGDRLNLDLIEEQQKANRVMFTFDYNGILNGEKKEGRRKLELGVKNAKIISYELTEI